MAAAWADAASALYATLGRSKFRLNTTLAFTKLSHLARQLVLSFGVTDLTFVYLFSNDGGECQIFRHERVGRLLG